MKVDFTHVKPLSKIYMLQLKYVNYKILVGCPEFDFKQIKGFSIPESIQARGSTPPPINGHRASSLESKIAGV
jgi:hypothetical protein